MAKAISTKGVTGGVIGTIMAIAGFAWTITLLLFIPELLNYSSTLSYVWAHMLFTYTGYAGIIATLIIPYPSTINLFTISSVTLAILVVVFGTMIGFGFRDLYSKSRSSVGWGYLAASILGTLVAGILIAMGGLLQTTIIQAFQYLPGLGADFIPLRFPATSYTWTGEIVLGATLIILGVASILIRKSVERRDSALAAGVLSIIGGIILTLHISVLIPFAGQVSIAPGGFSIIPTLITAYVFFINFTIIGFGLLLVVSILWTRVFLKPSTSK
ncbi:MAG: hypothetical protein ACETWM_21065 [Candidatus Lokiarchaeia archaeon]